MSKKQTFEPPENYRTMSRLAWFIADNFDVIGLYRRAAFVKILIWDRNGQLVADLNLPSAR